MLSVYVPFRSKLNEINFLELFRPRTLTRDDKFRVQKALKEKLSSYTPGKQGTIVFLGITNQGTVAEAITPLSVHSESEHSFVGREFDKKMLQTCAKNPPETPVMMVDEAGTECLVLLNDSIRSLQRVAFHVGHEPELKKRQMDVFKKELESLKKRTNSTSLVLGLQKEMKWLKDEASELLQGFESVIASRITEVDRMNLDNVLISSFSELSEFDIVLEMKTLRDLSSTLDNRTTSGLEESLVALQGRRLRVLIVLSTVRVDLFVPRDDEHGWATTTNERGEHLLKRIDIFQWLEENEQRLSYKAVVITSDLPQRQQLERVGGVAGILK